MTLWDLVNNHPWIAAGVFLVFLVFVEGVVGETCSVNRHQQHTNEVVDD